MSLTTHAVAALIAAALAAGAAWTAQSWRYERQISDMRATAATADRDAEREARTTESRRSRNVQDAQNAQTQRTRAAQLDAAAARTELDRLRADLAQGAQSAGAESPTACTVRAAAVGDVLSACAGAYQELAGKADGHVNDVRTLSEAWPK